MSKTLHPFVTILDMIKDWHQNNRGPTDDEKRQVLLILRAGLVEIDTLKEFIRTDARGDA